MPGPPSLCTTQSFLFGWEWRKSAKFRHAPDQFLSCATDAHNFSADAGGVREDIEFFNPDHNHLDADILEAK